MGQEILVAIPRSGEEEKEETNIVEEDNEKPQEFSQENQGISAFHILKTIFSLRNMYG